MSRPTRAHIHLSALRHNLNRVRAAAPGARVVAIIKADGYGHGLIRVARALRTADAFGVASIDEGLVLRGAGVSRPILLLEGFFSGDELELVSRHGFEVVVHHASQLEMLARSTVPGPVTAWMKVDTGMHRLGFTVADIGHRWRQLQKCAAVAGPVRVMTHLASADDRESLETERQILVFSEVVASLGKMDAGMPGGTSIANSAGVLGWPKSHGDYVRPGIMLYGISPFLGGRAEHLDLQPAMTLMTRLIAVKRIPKGGRVGYGGSWTCPEDMLTGVAAVGYGDGYPRHAPGGTPVLVNGARVPLIGRVSMDMISVDLRSQPAAKVGDPVVLWGRGLPVEEVAEYAGTIAYELVCRLAPRVPVVEDDS